MASCPIYEDSDHENTLRDISVLNLSVGILTNRNFFINAVVKVMHMLLLLGLMKRNQTVSNEIENKKRMKMWLAWQFLYKLFFLRQINLSCMHTLDITIYYH
jgi:hypothetical protein